MDLLADVLRQSGVKKRILNQRSFARPTALLFPCERSFGFHVVTQGRGYIHTAGEVIALAAGDVALMARGCNHVVSTSDKPSRHVMAMDDAAQEAHGGAGEEPPLLALVSGAYQVWNTPVHPFFHELPRWYVLRADEIGRLDEADLAIGLLARETAAPGVGSETMTQALVDIIFTQIVRKIIARMDATPQTWGHALHQVQVRAALELMHGDCAHDWSLEELARRVGLSRAGFAAKFKAALGSPPLQYLTMLRVQKAMDLLANTPDKLESVSQAVGYRDAFSFSKAFKKVTGMPPRDFRQKDRDEKDLSWRFR
jgi:AraC-like DNA-binding protein